MSCYWLLVRWETIALNWDSSLLQCVSSTVRYSLILPVHKIIYPILFKIQNSRSFPFSSLFLRARCPMAHFSPMLQPSAGQWVSAQEDSELEEGIGQVSLNFIHFVFGKSLEEWALIEPAADWQRNCQSVVHTGEWKAPLPLIWRTTLDDNGRPSFCLFSFKVLKNL